MRKENSVQLEIFSSDATQIKNQRQPKHFLNYIWNYEKIILSIIAFLIVGIISFSLGFEKGKKIVAKTPSVSSAVIEKVKTKESIQSLPVRQEVSPTITQTEQKNYTIQVATYKSKTYAQKEAQILRNKGFQPLIFSKENYIQLCVGKFSNKEEARLSLIELKKRYADSFIRRL